jgi:enoyl-CoA hydratase/carnithine racemase
MTDSVRYEVDGAVVRMTLDRPEARNALDAASLAALLEGLRDAAADPAVRAVVVTGEGSVFCAGADLAATSTSADGGFTAAGPQALADVLEAMLTLPKPVIARVQGSVAGGGIGLVAAADLAVAVDTAKFAFSEVRVGVAPAVISVVALSRMDRGAAAELMLTGSRVDAERARAAGLVQRVAAADELDAVVDGWVSEIELGGPGAVAATKQLLATVPMLPRADAWAWTTQLSASLFGSAEAAEGMSAFLQRRPANWPGVGSSESTA